MATSSKCNANYLDSITLRKCPFSPNCPPVRDCIYLRHLDICPYKPIEQAPPVVNTEIIDLVEEADDIECVWDSKYPKFSLYDANIDYRNPPLEQLNEWAKKGSLPPHVYNRMSKAARIRFNQIKVSLTKLHRRQKS